MSAQRTAPYKQGGGKQRGAALIIMLVIMVMGAAAILVSTLNSSALKIKRDEITADALAQAKEALIGYAVSVELTNSGIPNQARPGDLPCPDMDNDGDAESSCGNAAGDTYQERRLGRLPWKTLGLPDLRDASGERLWYAVSNNFKNNTRTATLNSDTPGTITVRTPDGNLLHDGSSTSGAVAIIFAPGEVLQRQGAALPQNHSCTIDVDCNVTGICTANPFTLTPKCNPVNYLDIASGQDNADFEDSSSANGFIQGIIKNVTGQVLLNDQLLVITQENMMQAIQKRVAAEVKQCLNQYALAPANKNRYPWATPINAPDKNDNGGTLFGRIPEKLGNTKIDSGNGMEDKWQGNCNTHAGDIPSTWWISWQELVFYGLAAGYKPVNPPATPTSCPGCLAVSPTSPATDKKFVVIVAGKTRIGQMRTTLGDKQNLFNYLEGNNKSADQSGSYTFTQGMFSSDFNDTVVFQK